MNLAGIDVILKMQESMERMEQEFNDLLESLREELRKREQDLHSRKSQALVKAPPARVIPIKKG